MLLYNIYVRSLLMYGTVDRLQVCAALPAGMRRKILGVIGVLLIFLKVQFCQQLAGFNHGVFSILQNDVGAINLWTGLEIGQSPS